MQMKIQLLLARIFIDKKDFYSALDLLDDNVNQFYMASRLIQNQFIEDKSGTHPKILNATKLMIMNLYLIALCHLNTECIADIHECLNTATWLSASYFDGSDSMVDGLLEFVKVYRHRIEPIFDRENELIKLIADGYDWPKTAGWLAEVRLVSGDCEEGDDEEVIKEMEPMVLKEVDRGCRRAERIDTSSVHNPKNSNYLVDYEYFIDSKPKNMRKIVTIKKKHPEKKPEISIQPSLSSGSGPISDQNFDKSKNCQTITKMERLDTSVSPQTNQSFIFDTQSSAANALLTQPTLIEIKLKRPVRRNISKESYFHIYPGSNRSYKPYSASPSSPRDSSSQAINHSITPQSPFKLDSVIAYNLIEPSLNTFRPSMQHSSLDRLQTTATARLNDEHLDGKDTRFFKGLFHTKQMLNSNASDKIKMLTSRYIPYEQQLDHSIVRLKSWHSQMTKEKAEIRQKVKIENISKEVAEKYKKETRRMSFKKKFKTEFIHLNNDQQEIADSRLKAQKRFVKFMDKNPEVFQTSAITDCRKRLNASPYSYCARPSAHLRPSKPIFKVETIKVDLDNHRLSKLI